MTTTTVSPAAAAVQSARRCTAAPQDRRILRSKRALRDALIELMEELKKKDVCILMAVHEQRLIKEVADIVYELQDGVLRPMASLPVMEQVYMHFSRQQEEKKLVCAKEESDACIQQYLMQGWHLDELRHENNL